MDCCEKKQEVKLPAFFIIIPNNHFVCFEIANMD